MRSTADDVLTALELIASRVPDRHVQPDTAMALSWLDSLGRFDHAAIFRAAREWGGLRFPSTGEFLKEVESAARAIAVEEAAKYASHELPVSDCREGCDDGWFFVDREYAGVTYLAVKPCARCQPVTFAIWQHRTARENHDEHHCPDCLAIRRGKPEQFPQWLLDARDIQARAGRVEERF